MSALIERREFEKGEPDRVIILNSLRQVLLLRVQDPKTHRSRWELPAADFVEGQEGDQALSQKVAQETGLEVQNLRPFFYPGRPPEKQTLNTFHTQYFSAQVGQQTPELNVNWSLRWGWFRQGQLSSLKMDEETRHAILVALNTSFN